MKAKVNFKVGGGSKDSFWNDNWIGQAPLKQQYLDLFNLCLQQQATIAKMWTGQGWNLNFRRHLSDWELGRVAALKSTMAAFNNLKEERIPC
uniref:Putative ovule protein n=1 Tax=Solanum chacoense TaxID=4108 RepID=A0A0V0H969_SOLCH